MELVSINAQRLKLQRMRAIQVQQALERIVVKEKYLLIVNIRLHAFVTVARGG